MGDNQDLAFYKNVVEQLYDWGISFMEGAKDIYAYFSKPIIDLSAVGGATISMADIVFTSAFTVFAYWVIKQFINPWWS